MCLELLALALGTETVSAAQACLSFALVGGCALFGFLFSLQRFA